jgi:hypothetical protein
MKKEPYQCEDPKCNCKRGDIRHCQFCGSLYLWNRKNKKGCIDCETYAALYDELDG